MERVIEAFAKNLAVIGAGLAGLACARAAQSSGVRATVFEKSRGLGGRLATRRPFGSDDATTLDHGAPFAEPSASYPDTISRLASLGSSLSVDWPPEWGASPSGAVRGLSAGMSSLAHRLAQGVGADEEPLSVEFQKEISAISPEAGLWRLQDVAGQVYGPFDGVVCAAPAPQSRALLGDACPGVETDASFDPVWAVLVVFEAPSSAMAPPPRFVPTEPPLARLYRQESAAAEGNGREAWVGHASSEWSSFHLEQEKDAVAEALLPVVRRSLKSAGFEAQTPAYLAAHRWRYGVVRKAVGDPFWLRAGSGGEGLLGCCGDWRLGGKAGDALASGERMGAAIAARLLA